MISIKEEINKLVELQEIDKKIFALRKLIEEKPQKITQLEGEFEEKKTGLKTLEDKLKAMQLARKEKENELGFKEENIKKLQTQLYSLKTNKEYQTMLAEIENHKADCSVIEDKILLDLVEVDNINKQINEQKQYLTQQENKLNEEKNKVNKEIADAQAQLEDLETKRAAMAEAIDPTFLKNYERILESRDGLAVVEVKNNSCQGCFMNMPPQVINEIKLSKHIVTCEMCNRILYINPE